MEVFDPDKAPPGAVPKMLKPLIGLAVERAWALSDGTLILRVGHKLVQLQAIPCTLPGTLFALQVKVGTILPGYDFSILDHSVAQTPFLAQLRGKKITGLDGYVVIFDGFYGAKISPGLIEWMTLPN